MTADEAYKNSLIAREKLVNETFDMVIQKIIDTSNKGGLAFHIFNQVNSPDNNKLFFAFCHIHYYKWVFGKNAHCFQLQLANVLPLIKQHLIGWEIQRNLNLLVLDTPKQGISYNLVVGLEKLQFYCYGPSKQ